MESDVKHMSGKERERRCKHCMDLAGGEQESED